MTRLEPIRESDALDAPTFLARYPPAHLSLRLSYRCTRCGRRLETLLPDGPVLCPRCGERMKATA